MTRTVSIAVTVMGFSELPSQNNSKTPADVTHQVHQHLMWKLFSVAKQASLQISSVNIFFGTDLLIIFGIKIVLQSWYWFFVKQGNILRF